MRQANEIYYGSQAQNLSFISNINIKISEEICLFYFISFFSALCLAGNKLFLLSFLGCFFLLFIIVIILIYVSLCELVHFLMLHAFSSFFLRTFPRQCVQRLRDDKRRDKKKAGACHCSRATSN